MGRAELELELIQPHMAQKPVLRGEVRRGIYGKSQWHGQFKIYPPPVPRDAAGSSSLPRRGNLGTTQHTARAAAFSGPLYGFSRLFSP